MLTSVEIQEKDYVKQIFKFSRLYRSLQLDILYKTFSCNFYFISTDVKKNISKKITFKAGLTLSETTSSSFDWFQLTATLEGELTVINFVGVISFL